MAGCQFTGYLFFSTPGAYFFQDHFWSEPDFLPKSQCTLVISPDTDEVTIYASDWICNTKGISEFKYIEVVPYSG